MNIYVITLLFVALLSVMLKGTKKQNKTYIFIIALILFLLCALRGVRVGSDLGRYQTHYTTCANLRWSEIPIAYQWSNIGFYFLCKIHSTIFGYNYHGFLVALAAIQSICLSKLVFKTSVNPYLSYTMYIALGYYVFTYSGLKQAMAMAFIMLAFVYILEQRKIMFVLMVLLAMSMHFPALVFLPAYFIGNHKIKKMDVFYLVIVVGVIYLFKEDIVILLSDAYGTVVEETELGGVGGKIIMMVALIVMGLLLRAPQGTQDAEYSCTFNFMIIATLLQTFASYGNVFERLADYYFMFAMIYIPYVLERKTIRNENARGMINYTYSTHMLISVGVFLFALLYYYSFISSSVGLLPYKFN